MGKVETGVGFQPRRPRFSTSKLDANAKQYYPSKPSTLAPKHS